LFFALSFGLAMVNKKPKLDKDLVPATAVESTESAAESTSADWWAESESAN
jgi:preprotein translocase subunit SecG